MRYAIISDIHANLEALKTALAYIEQKEIDKIVCLGDIVGYGANPNECVDLVRKHCEICILGNHDEAALDISQTATMTTLARTAAFWTHDRLTEESSAYLRQLPYSADLDEILLVHGSPYHPERWHYIFNPADAESAFQHFDKRICFVGHSHVPGIYRNNSSGDIKILKEGKFIINVGSVGQPRDGDSRLSFGLIETETWEYKNVRLNYPVDKAAEKIVKAGLPRALAERLYLGM